MRKTKERGREECRDGKVRQCMVGMRVNRVSERGMLESEKGEKVGGRERESGTQED